MGTRNVALALSRGHHTDAEWAETIERARAELVALVGPAIPVASSVGARTALVASGSFEEPLRQGSGGDLRVVPTSPVAQLRDGRAVQVAEHAARRSMAELEAELADVVAPFGCFIRDDRLDRVSAATDPLGMRHIYWARSTSVAYGSTSSALLARLIGAGLDTASCAVYSQLGHLLGDRSLFVGVHKLARGQSARFADGEVELTLTGDEQPQVVRGSGHFTDLNEAVGAGVTVVRRVVDQGFRAFPDPLLELSGGLDSRLILAAARGEHGPPRTLTIGPDDSTDMVVARSLVEDLGLRGSFVPFSILERWSARDTMERVTVAARGRDFASNAVSGAIYDAVGAQVPAVAQVTGAAGEQARGRYFAGQRARPDLDVDRVESLVHWQLVVNQAVDRALLSRDLQDEAKVELRSQAWEYFAGSPVGWPMASDQLYMFGRIQRWAGPAYSHWGLDHQVVAPYFHPDYVEWASRLPLAAKRTSTAFLSVLARIDRELATRPLANGLTPLQMNATGVRGSVSRGYRDGRRLVRKVRQRLAGRRLEPSGVGLLSHKLAEQWRREPPQHLHTLDVLDARNVEQFVEGRRELDAVSLAFLLNLEGAGELLARGPAPLPEAPGTGLGSPGELPS